MKSCLCLMLVLLAVGSARLGAQGVVVDPAVAAAARDAVQKLGLEMMRGNFKYSQERMYPRWKRRLALRAGSMERLEQQLAAGESQRIKMGLIVTDFRVGTPRAFFDVWRTRKLDPVTGRPLLDASGKEIIVGHWLAVVPTTTRVKVPDKQQGGKVRVLEEESYTLAVSEQGSSEWFFLTGLKPTVQDLRSLFPTLPSDEKELGLPTPKAREIK